MSYDNEALVKIIQKAKDALAELGLELAPAPHGASLAVDHRSDEELMGTNRKHALQLLIMWDGVMPEALTDPLRDPAWNPNAAAGDDYEMSDAEREMFASLDITAELDEDVTHDLEVAAEEAQRNEVVERFLNLRKEHGSD